MTYAATRRLSARHLSTLISDSCRVLAARKASHWPLLSACSRLAPRRNPSHIFEKAINNLHLVLRENRRSMRHNFEEEDSGRQSEDVEWLPLQHHPVFSTPPDRDKEGDRALTMPKNLLAWDGASRLYFWDSYKTCLHRLSVRLGEPDPTSLLATSPSKVLQADVQLNSEVQ